MSLVPMVAEVWSSTSGIVGLRAGFSDGSSSLVGSTTADYDTRLHIDTSDSITTLQLLDNGQGLVGGLSVLTDYGRSLVVSTGNGTHPPFQVQVGWGTVAGALV
jgi:hypothetical protein